MKNGFSKLFYLILSVLFLTSAFSLCAQQNEWKWLMGLSGSGNEVISDVCGVENGYFYSLINFQSDSITAGNLTIPNLGADNQWGLPQEDLLLVKFDSIGNLVWNQQAWGNNKVRGTAIALDHNNNLILGGNFYCDTLFFAQTYLKRQGNSDLFLYKLNETGSLVWKQSMKGNAWINAIQTDNKGNVLVAGEFFDQIYLGNDTLSCTSCSADDLNIFIAKFSSNGMIQWVRTAPGNDYDYISDLCIDPAGFIYITGGFVSNTLIFDSDTLVNNWASATTSNFYIAKMDSNGSFLWSEMGADPNDERGQSIHYYQNKLFVFGNFDGYTIDLQDTIISNSSQSNNGFIASYAPQGKLQWAKQLAGSQYQMIRNSTIDREGKIIFSGEFYSDSLQFGSEMLYNSSHSLNAFVAKIDTQGSFQWAEKIDGPDEEIASQVAISGKGKIVVGGLFKSNSLTIGSETIQNKGFTDTYISQISGKKPARFKEYINEKSFYIYPNPALEGIFYFQSETQLTAPVRVYDITGQLVSDYEVQRFDAHTIKITFTTPLNGIYLLVLERHDGTKVSKKIMLFN